MERRIQIDEIAPKGFKAMFALEGFLNESDLSPVHKRLIKLRASQINGCAYCIDMHTTEGIENGESPQRTYLLDGWRETDLYTDEERVILQITEEVTLISQQGLSTATYNQALELLGESYLAQAIMAVVTINAWNRIAISTHKPLEKRASKSLV
ncbi:MAG: carboxymuconolactone decarboxylase family protein [Marinoscillum sp.]